MTSRETTNSRHTPVKAGILGWPAKHSRSPLIHDYWLKMYGIEGSYEKLPATAEDFEKIVRGLVDAGYAGANVTAPHKEAAFALADLADARTAQLKAANLLVFKDGAIHASNTDGYGFLQSLGGGPDDAGFNKNWDKNWSAHPVALLGAGGASRAIIGVLVEAGVPELRISNRTLEKIDTLRFLCEGTPTNISAVAWDGRAAMLEGCGLLVNTTSLGMSGQPPLDISLDHLPDFAAVVDIVYAPLQTPLLRAAALKGLRAVDGLGMLLHQAVPSFAAWFGVKPEVTPELRQLIVTNLEGKG